jgi:hypothetical protein
MNELLDELVPPFNGEGDWNDVLRRAGRRSRKRALLAAAAVTVAAILVTPAVAVLLRHDGAGLPKEADRSNVAVVISPLTGRVLLQVAPWKGHDGFCYFVLVRAGCVPHKTLGTVVLKPPLFGWTFDSRVRSGTATTVGGKHVPLTVRHFGGRIDATLFLSRGRLPRLLRGVVLRDAAGKVVARINWP